MSDGDAIERGVATLELRAARFRESAESVEALTLRSEARVVGMIGEWGAFFRALTGAGVEGAARVCGFSLDEALAAGIAGFAPCDPDLPPSFTVTEYLEHAARLAHGSRSRAKTDFRRALDDFALAPIAATKLAELTLGERRMLVVATAALGAPAVCLLEAPLRGLDAAASDRLVRACRKIAERSRVIVSSEAPSTPSPARALLDACGESFWLERGKLSAHGTAAQLLARSSRYQVTFAGARSKPLEEALIAADCSLALRDDGIINGKPASRYTMAAPNDATATKILDVAASKSITVLELEPLRGE